MIDLDDPVWTELRHCYGSGGNVPPLLRKLEDSKRPSRKFLDEFANILYHQCTTGSASIAAFPHLVRIAGDNIETKKGTDTISVAAFLLAYVLGSEGKLEPIPKFLREPFLTAISEGQGIVSTMLFSAKRDFTTTAELLAVAAAFAWQPRLCLALDIQRSGTIMCPTCEDEFAIDRMFTF